VSRAALVEGGRGSGVVDDAWAGQPFGLAFADLARVCCYKVREIGLLHGPDCRSPLINILSYK
jgi:hypothetical protein